MSGAPVADVPAIEAPEDPKPASRARGDGFRPPLPHEHGAWVIVYAPMAVAFGALWPPAWERAGLLFIVVTGLFLGRAALGQWMRRRSDANAGLWLMAYLGVAAAAATPLVAYDGLWPLLRLGVLAAILFVIHGLLGIVPSRKRLERSQFGELLAVAALTLTAPAAYVAQTGRLDAVAWCLWAMCALYFGSGIIFVHTILRAIKVKGEFRWRERWRVGTGHVVYHVLLLLVIGLVTVVQGGEAAVLSFVAYLPAILRAFVGWATLTNRSPSFKRIGLGETFYALWFVAIMIFALREGQS